MNKTMISNVLLIWHYNRVHFLKVYLSVFWNMKVYFIKYTYEALHFYYILRK